jgi:hypothetical protein
MSVAGAVSARGFAAAVLTGEGRPRCAGDEDEGFALGSIFGGSPPTHPKGGLCLLDPRLPRRFARRSERSGQQRAPTW